MIDLSEGFEPGIVRMQTGFDGEVGWTILKSKSRSAAWRLRKSTQGSLKLRILLIFVLKI